MISIIVLIFVFILIAKRQVGNFNFDIWQIMLGGAVAVLITNQISVPDALSSINVDVILFLFGMFVVAVALEDSGYLSHLISVLTGNVKSVDTLVFYLLFGAGLASAILMNDSLAIIGTPVVLLISKKHNINAKMLLIVLAFAITIGSVMSPIGNPQNLLIAIHGNIHNSFLNFLQYLFIPTIINLFAAFLIIRIFYRKQFNHLILHHSEEPVKDINLANISKASLLIMLVLISIKVTMAFLDEGAMFKLTYIALAASLPELLFSKRRVEIVKKIDWRTLIFFASMFILMQSVWNTGIFQEIIKDSHFNFASVFLILVVGILLSQLISNVPLVALYLPVLMSNNVALKGMMALAAGSTIAGNLFILGAASNIIIIQSAEKKAKETITFFEFAKVGIPVTIFNALIYYLFLK